MAKHPEHLLSRNFTLTVLTIAVIVGNLVTAGVFTYFINLAAWRRTLALQGDDSAATRIILPCYRPIFRVMVGVYMTSALALSLSFFAKQGPADQYYELQFASLMMLMTFSVVPILLLQRSVSYKAFRVTACYIVPWFLLSTAGWAFTTLFFNSHTVMTLFWILSGLPSLGVSFALRVGLIKSRVHMTSRSARASVDYMLVYSVFYGVMNILGIGPISTYLQDKSYRTFTEFDGDEGNLVTVASIAAIFSILWNQFFPWAMYVTLLADTKYWRGLGRHNQQGFGVQADKQDGADRKRTPIMDIRLVTHDLQGVMREIGDIAVDFAFLEFNKKIGKGAHALVYTGKLKRKDVAIKLFTPEEVNQEVIQEFVREAKLSMPLLHPNIVNFMGICIRPPEIAMIMELCPGGDLKSNLLANAKYWTAPMRAQACLDGAHAVNYFHHMGYIHRDIKAENFFVTGDVTVINHVAVSAALTPMTAEEQKAYLARRDNDEPNTSRESLSDYVRDSLHMFQKRPLPRISEKPPSTKAAPGGREAFAATKGFSVKLGDFGESTKQRMRSDGTVEVYNEKLYNTQAHGRAGALDVDDVAQVVDDEVGAMRMSIKGTVAFLAPELVNAEKVYSEKIDIYSLGITFLEIWTGQDPWRGKSVFHIYQAVEAGQRPQLPDDLPETFKDIIVSCWEQDPGDRPTADMLTHMLEKFILDEYFLDMRRQQQFMTNKVRGSLGVDSSGDKGLFPNLVKGFKNASRRLSSVGRGSFASNSLQRASVGASGRSIGGSMGNSETGDGRSSIGNPIYGGSIKERRRLEEMSSEVTHSSVSSMVGIASADLELGHSRTSASEAQLVPNV